MTQSSTQASSAIDPTRNSRQVFIEALERRSQPGLVPHFELVFYLTMELLGKVHPCHRHYDQWDQMSAREKQAHCVDMATIYIDTARYFGHDAIPLHINPNTVEQSQRIIDLVRDRTGDQYFLMMHGDCTFSIPSGNEMTTFCYRMMDAPKDVIREAVERTDNMIRFNEQLRDLDGFVLCSDYCFNSGTFLTLDQFDEFVMPSLCRVIQAYRDMGYYTIKHTDGNIMPILDRLVEANPHALHSLDPQGGVDMKEIVDRVGDKVALCGNVHCGLMQTGTDEQVIESAKYALEHGLNAPGYIFSTSNCIYTGMDLHRYELILDVWRQYGVRQ